jgi:hypothetical protein
MRSTCLVGLMHRPYEENTCTVSDYCITAEALMPCDGDGRLANHGRMLIGLQSLHPELTEQTPFSLHVVQNARQDVMLD